jgi:hypothetical protein
MHYLSKTEGCDKKSVFFTWGTSNQEKNTLQMDDEVMSKFYESE